MNRYDYIENKTLSTNTGCSSLGPEAVVANHSPSLLLRENKPLSVALGTKCIQVWWYYRMKVLQQEDRCGEKTKSTNGKLLSPIIC